MREKWKIFRVLQFGFTFFRFLIPENDPPKASLLRNSAKAAMGYLHQLQAFLYKDLFIRKIKRHYIFTFLELALPIALLGLSVYMRNRGTIGAPPVVRGPEGFKEVNSTTIGLPLGQRTVAFAPDNEFSRGLIEHLQEHRWPDSERFAVRNFSSWDELEQAIESSNSTILALNLERVTPEKLSYMFSIDAQQQNSRNLYPQSLAPRISVEAERALPYPLIWNVFLFYTKFYHGIDLSPPLLQPMPAAEYLDDASFPKIIRYLSQLFLFSCVIFVGYFPVQIIQEKASRIRELLRMMGQSEAVYWHGLFLVGFFCMGLIAAATSITFAIPFAGYPVFVKSNPFLVFLLLIVFAVTTILLLMLVSVLFNGPAMGALVSILLWFFGIILSSVWMDSQTSNNYTQIEAPLKLLSLFLPPCGCYWTFKLIGFWEQADVGAQFSNLGQIASPGDNITLLQLVLVQFGIWLLYGFLIFYLDAIVPWQYGMPKHPMFLFRRSYWSSSCEPSKTARPSFSENLEMFEAASDATSETVVELVNVTKYFSRKKKAVDDLSVKFFKNQISVILGHNGAGKTTTMNILTGLFPPSYGNMFINGYSVRENTKKARESVGLCPQHNVLFDDLTVMEHLRYFGIMKRANRVEAEIVDLLAKFDLTRKKDTLSKDLSGGMKRKLSMANAMIGGSEILILDEPTAGMDPQARRSVWTILQEARKTRSILLTTHYMEEADVLGDRIAFLTAGKLRCAGSPMFLKKKFDTGYKMRVAKDSSDKDTLLTLEAISKFLDGAVLESNTNQEFCVNLGFPSTETLVQLFSHLEDNKPELGIANLGVSVTTMEDVFLKVGAAEESNVSESSHVSSASNMSSHSEIEVQETFPKFLHVEGFELVCSQFIALFVKRFNTIKREWWMPLFLFILPILLTLFFCRLDEWAYSTETESDVHYSLRGLYGPTKGFISNTADASNISTFLRKYMTQEEIHFDLVEETNFTEYLINRSYKDPLGYRIEVMMGVDRNEEDKYVLWMNEGPYHSALSVMLSFQRMIFEEVAGKPLELEVTSHPRDGSRYRQDTILKLFWVRIVSTFPVSLAVAFLTCSLIMNPIQENISKSKLLQLMSGVNRWIYFGSSFVFDFVLLVSSIAIMVATLLIYNPLDSFTIFNDTWQAILSLLLLYGYAMIPTSYLLAYIFTKPSTGFMYLLVFNVITGSIVVVVMALFDMLSILDNDTFNFDIDAINISLHVLNYVPAFSVVWGFVNIHVNGLAKSFCDTTSQTIIVENCPKKLEAYFIRPCCNECPEPTPDMKYCFLHKSPFLFDEKEAAGFQMLALFIMGTVLFLVLVLIETNPQYLLYMISNKLRRKSQPSTTSAASACIDVEDIDVRTEREITNNLLAAPNIRERSEEALIVQGLSKYYGSFLSVDNLTFRVHDGECFGLLGVNGAGKTTTFGMLTGDLLMSRGNAYIGDLDVKKSLREFQRQIGYCPQFDALISTMTGKELLQLFCSLRGVPRNNTNELVNFLIDIVDLTPHANKTAGSYSGGNKRKLSIALALIGNPRVLFLDEPTAGIDPSARRKIWNALMRAQKDIGSALILTSHSMEECEALCHRLCIMVNGRLRCLGSTQHLKSKFGEGFTVLIKLRAGQSHEAPDVMQTMEVMFPKRVILREHHQSLMHFHVTDTSLRWSTLFSKVDEINQKFFFEDVFVSDTTLEQIFLSFAKMQKNADEDGVIEDAVEETLPVDASSTQDILGYRY